MRFRPDPLIGAYDSEIKLWQSLKIALEKEAGRAYFGFRPRNSSGRVIKESDVLIVSPDFGLCVIECKGCLISNIEKIDGEQWYMCGGWHSQTMQPLGQARTAVLAVKNEMERFYRRELDCSQSLNIKHIHLVALPKITRRQWRNNQLNDELLTIRGAILFQDDLTPDRILARLKNYMPLGQVQLDKSQWEKIWQNCTESKKRAEIALKCAESISAQKLINDIQSRTLELDAVQNKLATEIPPGPQRLRGLAGTGKTIILSRRAALMHFLHSDWNIVFTFYTTTLTNEIKKLIDLAFREILSENGSQVRSPNWRKIRVIRSWGGKDTEGFYANLARASRSQFRSFGDAQKEINRLRAERTRYQNRAFAYVCDRLEEESPEIEPIYDAVIIDEGQDLPPSFFRLAYSSLTQPKRLYWAYDEAQAVNSLIVPNSESIFGRDEKTNKLRVDLQGQYEGGILKGCIMNRTYRSPRLLIMAAHAINMGLFRQGGVLQGVTTKADWQILGYEVGKNSDFLDTSVREGKHITVTRPNRNSPHEIDRPDFQLQEVVGELIRIRTFKDDRQEQEWIAAEVARDINIWGFDPKQILIARVGRDYQDCYSNSLKQILQSNGVAVHHAGVDGNKLNFKQNGCVTIANVHRAKGHEAWKVYVCRFDKAHSSLGDKTETVLQKRNEGFTALTRSKAWCVVTGMPSPIFEELETAVAMYPNFSFPAYNKKSLKRITNDEQG